MGNDYKRIRLGIGHPGDKALVHNHVLSDFAKAEQSWLNALNDSIARNADMLAGGDDPGFQNKVHLAMAAAGFSSE
jgi:PTH1 family peptidyl-tRNA hydrolase